MEEEVAHSEITAEQIISGQFAKVHSAFYFFPFLRKCSSLELLPLFVSWKSQNRVTKLGKFFFLNSWDPSNTLSTNNMIILRRIDLFSNVRNFQSNWCILLPKATITHLCLLSLFHFLCNWNVCLTPTFPNTLLGVKWWVDL